MSLSDLFRLGFASYPSDGNHASARQNEPEPMPVIREAKNHVESKGSDAKSHGSDQAYVLDRIGALAESKNGSRSVVSLHALFREYDSGGKGCLSKADLLSMLDAAGVWVKKLGFRVPQGMVADKIIDALDKSGDRCVSWDEYLAATATETEASVVAEVAKDATEDPTAGYGARTAGIQRYPHVGMITSQADVIAKVQEYVTNNSSKHDLSRESYQEIWNNLFGAGANVNQGGISAFLGQADACASMAGGCDGTADKFFKAFNQKLGLAADNGWMNFDQLATFLDLGPASADAPPPPPADPNVISDDDLNAAAITDDWITTACVSWPPTMGGPSECRAQFEDRRAAAIAKIARLKGGKFGGFTMRSGPTGIPGSMLTLQAKAPGAKGLAGLSTGWKVGLAIAIPTALYLLFRHKTP